MKEPTHMPAIAAVTPRQPPRIGRVELWQHGTFICVVSRFLCVGDTNEIAVYISEEESDALMAPFRTAPGSRWAALAAGWVFGASQAAGRPAAAV
jgi:hypothetical protein